MPRDALLLAHMQASCCCVDRHKPTALLKRIKKTGTPGTEAQKHRGNTLLYFIAMKGCSAAHTHSMAHTMY
jgi:hypothetical protein